ncbi:MAG: hypothetical protein ACRC7N_04650, partial [Clostridium sp.]
MSIDIKTKNNISDISIKTIDDRNITHIQREIIEANKTGFIDASIDSNLALTPKLVINDYEKGSKVLS